MTKQLKDMVLTIGHNVGATPTWNTAAICRAAVDVLGVDGLTAYTVCGVWRGKAEESTRIEICAVNNAVELLQRVATLAQVLQQNCIMYTVTDSHAQFITATTAETTAIL